MKYKLPIIYSLIFVCICLASIFILLHANQLESQTITGKTQIDNFIIQANSTEYNQQGQVKVKMTSEKIRHFLPQKTSIFTKPRIIAYTENRTPWHIQADQAIVNSTGEKIILQGHVVIRELPAKQPAEITTIKSNEITLFPKESRATTKQPVTLSRPGVTIHGVGFDANLKTGQYKLQSQSKAIYQFQPTHKRD
ncbi:MAG: LPS export ABC transporter periplasmic protein LptC [Gammaproteobacteria bacterium CG_4_10_14_0_8_um_filter_38_16]|nr:MAG: LPS export ABC transporter periplasmic protein LptC [Gammaproteobacteria bacterium CG_4_10_14_0_8_um_filter_38_16]PJA04187.1 MAG: LPS export ABC transporter periplasmic protein LptC [Gammaproteobacteria bacterium CG_4_10_14_0_2_um_filter_38_22]PJB10366.1 MAG: LPS export ABC transporter periplasmic protein LptC [Gammaproteobacteria bacterium CG_4_9_14_3_um_filter_38_9]